MILRPSVSGVTALGGDLIRAARAPIKKVHNLDGQQLMILTEFVLPFVCRRLYQSGYEAARAGFLLARQIRGVEFGWDKKPREFDVDRVAHVVVRTRDHLLANELREFVVRVHFLSKTPVKMWAYDLTRKEVWAYDITI